MPDLPFNIQTLALQAYRLPSITAYNRLEVSPRTVDFDRSLKAEVRDAMWMLTRQWQFGEFQGEDAATAMSTKILAQHTKMDEIHFPDNHVFAYDGDIPMEALVEREKPVANLALAVQMSRYFIKLIKATSGFNTTLQQLIALYPLNYQIEETDVEGSQLLQAVSSRVFDGFAFYKAVEDNTVQPAIASVFVNEIQSFKDWFERSYSQPKKGSKSPWRPSQLDYQFEVTTSLGQSPKRKLIADHYHAGHLDWYSFNIEDPNNLSSSVHNGTVEDVQSYIPSPVTFKGMPNPRYWMMEESRTDFGKIDASPTGLLHLLLAEFGLTCSNDWFMLPYVLPVNTLCEISGVVVKDVFGEYTLVRPSGKGSESQWQRWAMFHHTNVNKEAATNENLFYLVPAVIKSLEGPPIEKVNFIRDEMANMVWAVETIVQSQSGVGVNGSELALEKESVVNSPTSNGEHDSEKPAIRYVLGTTVPHHWIPFIPVHVDQSDTEIMLQRAKLPFSKGALGQIVKENKAPYYIAEEMIPRSGIEVTRSYQLARFVDGSTCLWIGRKKQVGRVHEQSNLIFDQIENI